MDSLWRVFLVHVHLVIFSVFCHCWHSDVHVYFNLFNECISIWTIFLGKRAAIVLLFFHGDRIESHTSWACQVDDATKFLNYLLILLQQILCKMHKLKICTIGCYLNWKLFIFPPEFMPQANTQLLCAISQVIPVGVYNRMQYCHLDLRMPLSPLWISVIWYRLLFWCTGVTIKKNLWYFVHRSPAPVPF